MLLQNNTLCYGKRPKSLTHSDKLFLRIKTHLVVKTKQNDYQLDIFYLIALYIFFLVVV